ncbi:MAG: DNA ligase D [Planctomyces sp.]|nr:DNA ligase D [Planctomyces sp.]
MPLADYRRKRDFRTTPEPSGEARSSPAGFTFVVQKHAASRLHYDFRLELDGVLKSWAVPKGPSLDPAVKALAVEVEDHPLDYAGFEGVIPKGEYGGGTVMVWDRGRWEPENDPQAGLRKGDLKFRLQGEKLQGSFALIRMRSDGDGRHNWLLIKHKDSEARPGDGHGLLEREPTSVLSGRDLDEIAAAGDRVWNSNDDGGAAGKSRNKRRVAKSSRNESSNGRTGWRLTKTPPKSSPKASRQPAPVPAELDPAALPKARRAAFPKTVPLQLATLSTSAPDGEPWLHELKFDGYRVLAKVRDGRAQLITRGGKDWTRRFTPIAEQLLTLTVESAILDGEVVAVDERGVSRFQRLQNSLKRDRPDELLYYVFDLLYLDGFDLRSSPLSERKALLASLFQSRREAESPQLAYSDHIEGNGPDVLRQSCEQGLEGIICKRADSPYAGARNRNWLKVKCGGRQEFVIVGFTAPRKSRVGFGALLLGVYEGDQLRYAGRVGTGFDQALLKDLARRLSRIATKESPLAETLTAAQRRGVAWVRPELVAEVRFTDWTDDGLLRHPAFLGLREDKPPREIVRETPAGASPGKGPDMPAKSPSHASPKKRGQRAAKTTSKSTDPVEFSGVRLTSPDRQLFDDPPVSKSDLAAYYVAIADWALPWVTQRPLSLVRCPDGQAGECFYQKHWTPSLPESVRWVKVDEKRGSGRYVVIEDLAGLIGFVQISTLELHPWNARTDRLDAPDMIVFDLDPAPDVDWAQVQQGARDVRDVLSELGLKSFLRTSGGKGLHVVVPLTRRSGWDEVSEFARHIATGLAQHAPDRYIANMRKELRTGKVFVDYLRNQRGATSIACYSTRSRPGAPVATPLDWQELGRLRSAHQFTIESIPKRLQRLSRDPWEDFHQTRQSLTREVLSRARDFAS